MRYNRVKIKNVWLTKDGTALSKPCRISVKGLERLQTPNTGTTRFNADGSPIVQLAPLTGELVSISSEQMSKTVYESIRDIFIQFETDGQPFELSIEGDTGDFTGANALSAVPNYPNNIEFSGVFRNGELRDVTFNMRIE